MSMQLQTFRAELLKNKNANILWVSFAAFSLAPLMGGVFMLIMKSPDALARTGALQTKIKMMEFTLSWNSYLSMLTMCVGVGGILVFGFVASWLFGREYSEGTAKDLLALPSTRTQILNAKFMVYSLWCVALVTFNLLVGILIGLLLKLEPTDSHYIKTFISNYTITTLLTLLPGTPIAFFALWGKGYLPPLGFVVLTLVFAQIIAAIGYGQYFPWSIPGLFSNIGGGQAAPLNALSYLILLLTGLAGYIATITYWKYTDQT